MGFVYLVFLNAQVSAENPCLSPARPWVPISDADIVVYADIIAEDFENYFSDLTNYFQCLDSEREKIIYESQQVGVQAEHFWKRVKMLGIESKIISKVDNDTKE